jgi:ketosteroid isomerase-like protein
VSARRLLWLNVLPSDKVIGGSRTTTLAASTDHTNCWRKSSARRTRDVAAIRVYDEAGNVIDTQEHTGEFKEPFVFSSHYVALPARTKFPMTPRGYSAITRQAKARSLDHFGMNMRSLFVCSALLLFASAAYGAGSYQRTRDGKTLVWNDSPKRGEEATWSGKRDKNGFAAGSGTLTWYKVQPTIVTGSHIPDSRYAAVINRYSGKMVRGKFKGAVAYVDANGKRLQATFVNGGKRPVTQQTATPTPERTSAPAKPTPTPAPEQSSSPAAQETPTAVPQQTATLAAEQTATRTSEQQARQPDPKSTIVPIPTPPDDSMRSLTALPKQSVAAASPKTHIPSTPPPLHSPILDEETVAALDTLYQKAVKANDIAIMDQILADDFVLITDRGASLTKADLIKEAQEKRTIYEHQEEEEGTQKVRVWRDTAVVTQLLRIKGTRDQDPFDYKVWFCETYVRTPTGWRYVFGQASLPLPKPDAK